MNSDPFLLDAARAVTVLIIFKVIVLLCAAFFAILFCQSGLDKMLHYSDNKSYFESQFSKSVFRNSVNILLPVLTVLEVASGLFCAFGIVWRIIMRDAQFLGYGLVLSACTLLCLLLGQRVAKDYAGSASIPGYFVVAILGLIALSASI